MDDIEPGKLKLKMNDYDAKFITVGHYIMYSTLLTKDWFCWRANSNYSLSYQIIIKLSSLCFLRVVYVTICFLNHYMETEYKASSAHSMFSLANIATMEFDLSSIIWTEVYFQKCMKPVGANGTNKSCLKSKKCKTPQFDFVNRIKKRLAPISSNLSVMPFKGVKHFWNV